eukprot:gene32066-51505_t
MDGIVAFDPPRAESSCAGSPRELGPSWDAAGDAKGTGGCGDDVLPER